MPIDQTSFGPGKGNCFSACVASIIELPIEDVPQFMSAGTEWFGALSTWCAERGLVVKYWPCKAWCETEGDIFLGVPTGLAIMSGESPRHPGVLHSVVALDAKLCHDPHPSRQGIVGRVDCWDFVTIEPAVTT